MPDIPKCMIPPDPDIPFEKNKDKWADYWSGCLNRGETLIATPFGYCRDYSCKNKKNYAIEGAGIVIGIMIVAVCIYRVFQ